MCTTGGGCSLRRGLILFFVPKVFLLWPFLVLLLVYWRCPFDGAAFRVFRAEAVSLFWPFLVFASVYWRCPCAGRHLLFFVPQGDFLRGVFQRKVSKRKALRKLTSSRCVIFGEWQPMKCRPHTSWDIGPRAIPAHAHSTLVTRLSSTRLRAARVADRHNPAGSSHSPTTHLLCTRTRRCDRNDPRPCARGAERPHRDARSAEWDE
ncbi:hypothetical protein R70241_05413 [Paraburkholderia saeva]|nr:hypothetical protein R70241_05413 [Paraburkholderia saeva]